MSAISAAMAAGPCVATSTCEICHSGAGHDLLLFPESPDLPTTERQS